MERERIIEMRSLTDAMAARDALYARGIKSVVTRSKKSRSGCGYALTVNGDVSAARRVLSSMGFGGRT